MLRRNSLWYVGLLALAFIPGGSEMGEASGLFRRRHHGECNPCEDFRTYGVTPGLPYMDTKYATNVAASGSAHDDDGTVNFHIDLTPDKNWAITNVVLKYYDSATDATDSVKAPLVPYGLAGLVTMNQQGVTNTYAADVNLAVNNSTKDKWIVIWVTSVSNPAGGALEYQTIQRIPAMNTSNKWTVTVP